MTNDSVNESGDTDSCNASDDPHHNIAAAITVLSEKYEASQQDSGEHDRQTLRWTQRATIGVGIYTVLTLVAVVLTYCSLRNAQEQSAITAAQLAMATNSERAYIFLTDLQIDSESAILAPPQISAVWRNYGKTPGILIDAFYRLKTFRIGELYDHTTLASLSIGPTQGVVQKPMPVLQRYTIASGDISERFIFHANPPMYSAETIDRIKKGEIRIVALSGEYSYADMFGFVYTQCFRYSRALPLFGTHNSQPAIPPRFFNSGYECQGGGTRQRAQDFKSKTKFGLVSAPKE